MSDHDPIAIDVCRIPEDCQSGNGVSCETCKLNMRDAMADRDAAIIKALREMGGECSDFYLKQKIHDLIQRIEGES